MWSLGCVFLELLVWAVFDSKSVKIFTEERVRKRTPSDHFTEDGFLEKHPNETVTLRDPVQHWIGKLEKKVVEQRQQPFKEILDFIIAMLEIDRNTRILAKDVSHDMTSILTQKKIDLEQGKDESRPVSRGSETSSVSLLPQRSGSSASSRASTAGFVTAGFVTDESPNPLRNTGLVSAEYSTTSPVETLK